MEYVFTDVSPLFTLRAEEKFKAFPFVSHRLLNIETDPSKQGFTPHSFDLVLAANVLHATASLRETLANVRQLLAPDGLLMLLEGTGRQRWADLIFGLTPGWWRFADTDLRPEYPLLSRKAWLSLLSEEGFPEAAALPGDSDEVSLSKQALVMARGPGIEAIHALAKESAGSWLLFADRGNVGRSLAEQLVARGHVCRVVYPDDKDEFAGLLSSRDAPYTGVVHLRSLDDEAPGPALRSVEDSPFEGCRSALRLIQALAQASGSKPPRLWLITRGAQALGQERAAIAVHQAPLWGLGQVVLLEHPHLQCVRVDLDPDAGPERHALDLVDEVCSPDRETQVAFRDGIRHGARLRHSAAAAPNDDRLPAPPGNLPIDARARGIPRRRATRRRSRCAANRAIARRAARTARRSMLTGGQASCQRRIRGPTGT
jgi:SAM-dependent methyltransferase